MPDHDDPLALLGAAWSRLGSDLASSPADAATVSGLVVRLEKLLGATLREADPGPAAEWARSFLSVLREQKALYQSLKDSTVLRRVRALASEVWKQHYREKGLSKDEKPLARITAMRCADLMAKDGMDSWDPDAPPPQKLTAPWV